MATSLDRIPAELFEPISSGLATHDLLNLCKSCKSLYLKTRRFLFRQITISWDVEAAPDNPPKVHSLLTCILRNPEYASYIKRVEILSPSYDDSVALSKAWMEKGIQSPLSLQRQGDDDRLATLVKDVINELQLPNPNKWYQGVVDDADLGAIVALLLAQCTQLESLSVNLDFITRSCPWSGAHPWFKPYNPWFPVMFKHAMSAPDKAARLTRFERLTQFIVSVPENTFEYKLDIPRDVFLFSFYLPNVTSLCLDSVPYHAKREFWNIGIGSLLPPFWPLPNDPLPSRLTKLRLSNSSAPPSTIEFFLKQTPNLQSLFYDCKDPPSKTIDIPYLQMALDHVRDSLKQLKIKYDPQAGPIDPYSLVSGAFNGYLRSLGGLEDLEISLGVLFGPTDQEGAGPESAPRLSDALPASLKRLTINDDLWESMKFAKWRGEPGLALLRAFFGGGWETATPLLEEFVFDLRKNGSRLSYWGRKETREELQQLVENQGIRCSILPWGARQGEMA